ncbi:transcription termination/antitermination protein NusG [Arcanobacterium bovis]|uniref:Transcription termination/antitermination protein NusG n=1 Tax=Arcanobacterium bovis TaxID=2529275 RepID=A0A4Q9V3D1_9ACTO|nr:transcription termination/antitermination protein NusG [Arcanobacterium bovis]TBW23603.1 transcription termination/antitermination factor NusG [Arcanobacterium bovis]
MPEETFEPQNSPLFSDGSTPEVEAEAPVVETTSGDVAPEAVEAEAGSDVETAEEPTAEETAPTAETEADGVDTEEMVRARLRGLPGRWYVLHTYAGYEKRVKQDLEIRIHSMDMEDYIFQVEVPMEEVIEVKKGQNKRVSRVRIPGYALVRMDLTDDSWRVVQETNGVTGFVGNGRNPVALTKDEIVKMLTPVVEQEVAQEAVAAGKPVKTGAPVLVAEYEVGETVTLITEPWVGMPATISQVDAVNQRLTVLMTLVGQETPVDLSFSQVQKMD